MAAGHVKITDPWTAIIFTVVRQTRTPSQTANQPKRSQLSAILERPTLNQPPCMQSISIRYKKLSYRRGTARCVVSVEILPIATQQCRNYL